MVPGTLTLELSDGTAVDVSGAGPAWFFGFYSDQPIESLIVTSDFALYATVNDLYLGQTVPSLAPSFRSPARRLRRS